MLFSQNLGGVVIEETASGSVSSTYNRINRFGLFHFTE